MAAAATTMKPEDIRALILPLDAGPQARANGITPTGQLPGNSDIRLFLASTNMLEASPAVEVLRGSAVTQIKLHLPTDAGKGWFSTPKRLVFGERDLEDNFGEEEEDEISTKGNGGRNWADLDEEEEEDDDFIEEEVSQEEHRSLLHLLVKLCDIETITVKATEVSWNDTCVEREFCIPLNRRQRVGDVVQRIKSADAMEPETQQIFLEESYDRLSVMLSGRVLPQNAVLGDVLGNVSMHTVLHLLVHRSAKIHVKYQQQGKMEVTITSGMSSEEIAEKLRCAKGWRTSSTSDLNAMSNFAHHEQSRSTLGSLAARNWRATSSAVDLTTYDSVPSFNSPVAVSSVNKPMNIRPRTSPLCYRTNSMRNMTLYPDDGSLPINNSSHNSSSSSGDSPLLSTPPLGLSHSIEQARAGLMFGRAPALAPAGTGGTYFLCDPDGSKCAVFKPMDEEPMAINNPRGHIGRGDTIGQGMRKGTVVGEGATREVAAYILDHDSFSGVPPTTFAHIEGGKDRSDEQVLPKRGSLQQYVACAGDCEEMGTAGFDVEEVHKISVLDLRMANTDRNGGNILVRERGLDEDPTRGKYELVPIDHGYTLPHTLQDVSFEWEFWHQASVPYSRTSLMYIERLDAEADLHKLAASGIDLPAECRLNFKVCTMLLKKGASAGLPPAAIASVVTRKNVNQMSNLEKILASASKFFSPQQEELFLRQTARLLDEFLEGFKDEALLDELEIDF